LNNNKSYHTQDQMNIYQDNNIACCYLKYPSGKKDGNKLGKRKKSILISTIIIYGNSIFCNPKDYQRLKELDEIL